MERRLGRTVKELTTSLTDTQREEFELHTWLSERLRLEPRKFENDALVRIRSVAADQIAPYKRDAQDALDRFYTNVRVPEVTRGGQVVTDEHGAMRWKRDAAGRYIEDWSDVDGVSIEAVIQDLQRVLFGLTETANDLHMQAQFAWNTYDLEYSEIYQEIVDGTVKDRESRAKVKTRDSRYYYFFCYYLWKQVSDYAEQIKSALKRFEFLAARTYKKQEA